MESEQCTSPTELHLDWIFRHIALVDGAEPLQARLSWEAPCNCGGGRALVPGMLKSIMLAGVLLTSILLTSILLMNILPDRFWGGHGVWLWES